MAHDPDMQEALRAYLQQGINALARARRAPRLPGDLRELAARGGVLG